MRKKLSRVTVAAKAKRFSVIALFRKARFMAIVIGLSMVYQMVFPTISYALTSGPTNPNFTSFEPVATTNMVNDFTGQFTYNLPVIEIPGANGSGYALSLSYHSGENPEAEASWVGYGWTLNPGCINRSKRGLPDDFNGNNTQVKHYNQVPANWTAALSLNEGLEAFSFIGLGANQTVSYNNYKGFGLSQGLDLSIAGGAFSLGYAYTDGEGVFSVGVNPAVILEVAIKLAKQAHNKSEPHSKEEKKPMNLKEMITHLKNKIATHDVKNNGQNVYGSVKGGVNSFIGSAGSSYVHYLLTDGVSPYNITPYTGARYSGNVSLTIDPPPAPLGFSIGASLCYSQQTNVGQRNVPAYGYMYSGQAPNNDSSNSEGIMDYTLENASNFTQRDQFLPIPFSTPDAFFVSGEGVGGGFRMYNDKVGIFSPNFAHSTTFSYAFGLDIHLGLDDGFGADIIVNGSQDLVVHSGWSKWADGNTDDYWFVPYDYRDTTHIVSEASLFRFNNDLGGKLIYDGTSTTNQPVAAILGGSGSVPTLPSTPWEVQSGSNIGKIPSTSDRRSARTSYIGYRTNNDIKTRSGRFRPLAYEKDAKTDSLGGKGVLGTVPGDGIGELMTSNEDGNQYVYGLPVYSVDEKSMSRGISKYAGGDYYIINGDISNNTVVGEEYLQPYASQYLLTQITTPDYVDVNQNGPDDSDFGGYTKFIYKRSIGHDDKTDTTGLFKWRAPYEGMYYRPNKLSNPSDDMGSYQSGYKEVYYLDTIQTKSHYAVFVTDTSLDGMQSASEADAAKGQAGQGNNHRKLSLIKLYAKSTHGGPDQLIKTVHFDYNYDCWPSTPNSAAGNGGRLTLKRVWFEYNGIANAYISPYVFNYKYPTSAGYPSQYQYIQDEMSAYSGAETPNYNPYIDCWGNYQYDGSNRRNKLQCWKFQAPVASSSYDPAAWQLKQIVLPSGGEIHIQYEQNTYSYVQDQPACAMVKLAGTPGAWDDHFYLDVDNDILGITSPTTATDQYKQQLVDLLKQTYQNQKIYFKFFYTLPGGGAANIGDCRGDYLDGYVNFVDAAVDMSTAHHWIKISIGSGGADVQLPYQVCDDYIRHEVGGMLLDGSCKPSDATTVHGPSLDIDGFFALGKELINATKSALDIKDFFCKAINPDISYFRIPLIKKSAGGIRVKRLLMYNKGIDVNSQTLFGTQYIYDNDGDGTSYGVATNEPVENKEENPLVTYLKKRSDQGWKDRLIAGKDKEQFEGPLGWNALPSASIGYGTIIKKNIAQTKDVGTGFNVSEYYTVKDFPYDYHYNQLNAEGRAYSDIQMVKDNWSLKFGFFQFTINTGLRSSQGYCFIQNEMHGQIKQITNYPGIYDPVKFYNTSIPPAPVSQEAYTYFEPGEQVPMYDFKNWGISYEQPGKEMDMTIDRRDVEETSDETRITGDATVGILILAEIFYPIAFPLESTTNSRMNTIVTNKVLHYPTLLKRRSVMKDGYYQYTDNTAFDPISGRAVLTKTYDGFNQLHLQDSPSKAHNGAYTSYNVPASSQFQQMGQRAWNEHYCFYTTTTGSISYSGPSGGLYTINGVNVNGMFTSGDLVALHFLNNVGVDKVDMVYVDTVAGSNIAVYPAISFNTTVLPSVGGTHYYKAEIVHSGYTNQLTASAGGFLKYGDSAWYYFIKLNQKDSILYPSVVKANLTLFDDNWNLWSTYGLSTNTYPLPTNFSSYNPYESGVKGKWRPISTYSYSDTVVSGAQPYLGQRIYHRAGTALFKIDSNMWKNIMHAANPGLWIRSDTVYMYSPDGNAVLDADVDNVFSTAKYGYHGILPYIVSQNSMYASLLFESFENIYNTNQVEDGMTLTNPAHVISSGSHTGKYSYFLGTFASGDFISTPVLTDNIGNGLVIRFWARVKSKDCSPFIPMNMIISGAGSTLPLSVVGRSGDWALFEATWNNTIPFMSAGFTLKTSFTSYPILVDDIRIQPREASAMAYVYDVNSYRVVATMDDQNFATYYQYNAEGKLVRKLAETVNGIKTVEETEYHIPMTTK